MICDFCGHNRGVKTYSSGFGSQDFCEVCARLNGVHGYSAPSNTDILRAIVGLYHALGVHPLDEEE